MAMKCADLGHLASAENVHLKWVSLLEEEFFRQGDLEKARNYPVSPLMDRQGPGITMSQPGGCGSVDVCPMAQETLTVIDVLTGFMSVIILGQLVLQSGSTSTYH